MENIHIAQNRLPVNKVVEEDEYVHWLIQLSDHLDFFITQFRQLLGKAGPNFSFDLQFDLKVNWTLLEALQEHQASIDNLKGIQFNMKLQSNSLLSKTLRKHFFRSQRNLIFIIGVGLLKQSCFNFHFKEKQEIKDILKDFGLEWLHNLSIAELSKNIKQVLLKGGEKVPSFPHVLSNINDNIQVHVLSDVGIVSLNVAIDKYSQIYKKVVVESF